MTRIYLDNNATTELSPVVLEAMTPFLSGAYGNASSLHREGRRARRAIESSRERIAELLDADPRHVIFTSGGTEANNLAILGACNHVPGHVVTSSIEHPSVQTCFDSLSKRGFHVDRLPVTESGIVDEMAFREMLEGGPLLVSVMLANNETGAIQPICKLAQAARAAGALFHTDAVQAAGKLRVSFRSLGVTSLSISAHKFHGPVGVGALLTDSTKRLAPMLLGGHQEFGLRAGTEPAALIVGLASALELAVEHLETNSQRLGTLSNQFLNGLVHLAGPVMVNGPGPEHRLSSTLNLQFPGVDGQAAVVALDLEGIACSTGSACSSGAPGISSTLTAMGLNSKQARSSIRFSLSASTTTEEILRAVQIISNIVSRLRKSPAFR